MLLSSLVAGLVIAGAAVPRDVCLPVMSLREFGRWYSAESGTLVIVDSAVEERDIYVNVRARSMDDVMGFVIEAAGLTALEKNGSITLRDRPFIATPEYRKLWKDRVADIGTVGGDADGLRKAYNQFLISNDRDKDREYLKNEGQEVILAEFASALDFDMVWRMEVGDRIVFSTHPTRLQKAWPGDWREQLERLDRLCLERENIFLPSIERDERIEMPYNQSVDRWSSAFWNGAAQMVGSIRRDKDDFRIEVKYFDDTGGSLADEFSVIDFNKRGDDLKILDEVEFRISRKDEDEIEHIQKLYRNFVHPVTQDYLKWMATVDKVHPLSGVFSRILDFGCEVTGQELVTEITGIEDIGVGMGVVPGNRLSSFFAPERNSLVVRKPTWESVNQRRGTGFRQKVAQLARLYLGNSGVGMSQYLDIVAPAGQVDLSSLDSRSAILGSPWSQPDMFGERLVGRLSPGQRTALYAGQPIEILAERDSDLGRELLDWAVALDRWIDIPGIDPDGKLYESYRYHISEDATYALSLEQSWPVRLVFESTTLEFLRYGTKGYQLLASDSCLATEIGKLFDPRREDLRFADNSYERIGIKIQFGQSSRNVESVAIPKYIDPPAVRFGELSKSIRETIWRSFRERQHSRDSGGRSISALKRSN